jgi:hypothetical protein
MQPHAEESKGPLPPQSIPSTGCGSVITADGSARLSPEKKRDPDHSSAQSSRFLPSLQACLRSSLSGLKRGASLKPSWLSTASRYSPPVYIKLRMMFNGQSARYHESDEGHQTEVPRLRLSPREAESGVYHHDLCALAVSHGTVSKGGSGWLVLLGKQFTTVSAVVVACQIPTVALFQFQGGMCTDGSVKLLLPFLLERPGFRLRHAAAICTGSWDFDMPTWALEVLSPGG